MAIGSEVIAAVSAAGAKAPALPDPQPVDLTLVAERPQVARGAYADLRDPAAVSAQDFSKGWVGLAESVAKGTNGGLVSPHMRRLEMALERHSIDPGSSSPQELMLLALNVQNASAVSHMLSSSVSTVKKSVQTLVERTG